ncbi:MAG: S46 family peptidase [Proteobacteria bacterium]|nr:S46 family peptidase [Pseudomonadota bacterium]
MIYKLLLLFLLTINLDIIADEGMWEPYELPKLESELRKSGFTKGVSELSNLFEHPMSAIVSLGGCSAAFISPEGLIATNYHCIESSFLQYNSSDKQNLFETGFLARSRDEEKKSAPGGRVYITIESKEITNEVLAGIDDNTESLKRSKLIEDNKKRIIKECENSEEIECRVRTFFSGESYKLEKLFRIKDVRLVYAPPAYVGEFGGEIDNWMYPRHTGDFALLRAYVGKDKSSKEYSKNNIPYKSNSYLKISAKGVNDGDFVMVLGYPGRTNRLLTYNEIEYDVNIGFNESIKFLNQGIKLIEENTDEKSGTKLKYRGRKSGFENYYKKISGQNEGAKNFELLKTEKAKWEEFLTFVEKNASEQEAKYLQELLALIDESLAEDLAQRYYGNSTLISMAQRIYRNAAENTKPDSERKPGYQNRDQERLSNSIKRMDFSFDSAVDKAIFLNRLESYKNFSKDLRRPVFSKELFLDESFAFDKAQKKVDQIYSSNFTTSTSMLKIKDMSLKELNSLNDPLIAFVREIYEESLKYEEKYEKRNARRQFLKSNFIKLLRKYNNSVNREIYADANGTLRVTYGNVAGISLRDGSFYKPFTTLEGIAEKHTGVNPFNVGKNLLEKISKKEYGDYFFESVNSVPVNFISTLDITNGNSGSATINSNFELVGLAFDGMIETIIADYKYIPQARTISVDSRYLLWTLDEMEKASNILDEITVVY